MTRTLFGLSVFSLAAVPWVMAATDTPTPEASPAVLLAPEISWSPERPGEGRLFRVLVASDEATPVMGVHGEVAGEELHFARSGGGVFESLAAVPVGAGSAVEATFRVVYEGGGE